MGWFPPTTKKVNRAEGSEQLSLDESKFLIWPQVLVAKFCETLAKGGRTVVEHSTLSPKAEDSNPTEKKKHFERKHPVACTINVLQS
jgi:hypothetical protein